MMSLLTTDISLVNQFFKNLDHKVSLKLHRPEGRDLERLGGKLEQR